MPYKHRFKAICFQSAECHIWEKKFWKSKKMFRNILLRCCNFFSIIVYFFCDNSLDLFLIIKDKAIYTFNLIFCFTLTEKRLIALKKQKVVFVEF